MLQGICPLFVGVLAWDGHKLGPSLLHDPSHVLVEDVKPVVDHFVPSAGHLLDQVGDRYQVAFRMNTDHRHGEPMAFAVFSHDDAGAVRHPKLIGNGAIEVGSNKVRPLSRREQQSLSSRYRVSWAGGPAVELINGLRLPTSNVKARPSGNTKPTSFEMII